VIIELTAVGDAQTIMRRPYLCDTHYYGDVRLARGRLRINDTVHFLCDACLSRVEETLRAR
jgi:uncharacterized protein YlaI